MLVLMLFLILYSDSSSASSCTSAFIVFPLIFLDSLPFSALPPLSSPAYGSVSLSLPYLPFSHVAPSLLFLSQGGEDSLCHLPLSLLGSDHILCMPRTGSDTACKSQS